MQLNKFELAEKILKKIEDNRDEKVMNFYLPIVNQLDILKAKGFTGKDLKLIKYKKKQDDYKNYYYILAKIGEVNEKGLLQAETYQGERNYRNYQIIELDF